jgi:hypothetical protein
MGGAKQLTEDVIKMSSSDGRIKAEARRFSRQIQRIDDGETAELAKIEESALLKRERALAAYNARLEEIDAEQISEELRLTSRQAWQRMQAFADRDERLDELVKHELALMRGRGYDAGAEKGKEFLWLHGLSFDNTYRDWGPQEGRPRVRKRIEALLELCQGDEQLLLRYYRRYLRYFFPITYRYQWNPVIVRKSGHVTIVHKWSRLEPQYNGGGEEGGEEEEE